MQIGSTAQVELVVTYELTAAHSGSGLAEVFSTPDMIRLMERTSCECINSQLEEGQGTVGTAVNIRHLAATPVGAKVRCESKLIEIDRRRLVFEVKVYDEKQLVGEGIHERFIINSKSFQEKADSKVK